MCGGKSILSSRVLIVAAMTMGFHIMHSAQAPQQDSRPSTLSGIVINAGSGEPLSGATVTIRPAAGDRDPFAGQITGREGRFVISNLPPGQYVLTAEKPSFIPQTDTAAKGKNLLSIADDSGDLSVTLELLPTSAVAGRITTADGDPLVGAIVQAVQTRLVNGHFRSVVADQTVSNDLGEYRMFGLRPGRYYVNTFYRDTASVLGLHRSPRKGREIEEGVSDDFAVTWYPGALDQNNAQALKVAAGRNLSNVDIPMQMSRSVTVAGSLENVPPGAVARVYVDPVEFGTAGTRQVFMVDPAKSGNQRFLFRSLPPGEYAFRAETFSGSQQLSAYDRLIVGGTPIGNLALSLQPSPSISGVVVLDDAAQVPEGTRLLLEEIDRPARLTIPVPRDGHFAARSISPGSYRISLLASQGVLFVKSLARDADRLDPLNLKLDRSMQSLSVRATALAAHVEGVALNSDSAPVTGGIAVATEISGAYGSSSVTEVDGSGHFDFGSLLPGEYRVMCFFDIESRQEITPEALIMAAEKGEKITLGAGESKLLHIVAVTEGSIEDGKDGH